MAEQDKVFGDGKMARVRKSGDAVLVLCFLLVLVAVPALTVFAKWLPQKQSSVSTTLRAMGIFTTGNKEPVKFEDIAPAAQISPSTRAQWRRRIGRALYNSHQFFTSFDEQFAFRGPLLRAHAYLQFNGVATSRSMEVLQGQNGWLFYTSNDAISQFRRARPFAENELVEWQRFLERERAWLAQRGIEFLVVVVPEKHTIYPEFMPSYLRRASAPSRFDQLMRQLSSAKFEVLDVRPALLNNKIRWPQHAIFYRTDTHWNALGAYVAYEATAGQLAQKYSGIRATPLSAFDLHFYQGRSGDLARLLGWQSVLREERVEFKPREVPGTPEQKSTFFQDGSGHFREKIVTRASGAPIQRAVIFADSFVCDTPYLSFLSRHFDALTVFRNVEEVHFDRDEVEKLKPQIVILEFAERNLANLPPR